MFTTILAYLIEYRKTALITAAASAVAFGAPWLYFQAQALGFALFR